MTNGIVCILCNMIVDVAEKHIKCYLPSDKNITIKIKASRS
jgi:hypothetical protein